MPYPHHHYFFKLSVRGRMSPMLTLLLTDRLLTTREEGLRKKKKKGRKT